MAHTSRKTFKLSRRRDERRSLVKNLATGLIRHQKLETTLPKAKLALRYVERLITKAKKGDLHNRRQIIAKLNSEAEAHRLVDQLAPRLTQRSSGHLRLTKTRRRKGDLAQLAQVTFVDDLSDKKPATKQPATTKTT